MKARTTWTAFISSLLLSALAGTAGAQSCAGEGGVRLNVEVTSLRNARGQVAVTVYPNDPKRFLAKGGKLLRQRVPAAAPVSRACFNLPAPGMYAVAIYHDENGDSDFNRGPVGMPTEGYGFSNDAPTRFSIPAFEAVRFRVAGPTSIRVRTRYPAR